MAKVFLDTNYFIDAIVRRPEKRILESLKNNTVFVSPLSVHIFCYILKIKAPNKTLNSQIENFSLVEFSENIVNRALEGPTSDLEDNVQLHSAAEAECDIFLTEDQKLIKMKFFGKVKISST